jgi:ATP synthase protein I
MAGAENDPRRARSGRDADDIRRRLDTLGEQLASAQARHAPPPDPEVAGRGRAMGQALRLATELVAGVVVGGFIGWALDRWLETKPFLMVVFLLLGAAAGILNVIRTAKAMQEGVPPGKDLTVDDDDD